nr:hypothetical protein [Pseudomonas sp. RIT-PI-S]
MDRLYRQALAEANAPALGELDVPLVSTVGLSLHFLATAHNWLCYQGPDGEFDPGFLDGTLFAALMATVSAPALAFYEQALALELRVLAVLPPQRVPDTADPRVFMAAQRWLIDRLQGLGVEVIDVRAAANDDSGLQHPNFCEANDPLHGNQAFGDLIVERLLQAGL